VSGFLWRLVFGVLLVRALRLAVRWAPTLTLWALAVACWPSVLLARLLRGRALPAAEARWPRLRPAWWLPAGAGLLVAGVALATATGGPAWAQPAQLAAGYLLGLWVAPLAVPADALSLPVALLLFVATAPLYVALAVVLAGLWPLPGCTQRAVDVHHAAGYARLGREGPDELLGVCERHHRQLHGR
jgi:hypothetical protein